MRRTLRPPARAAGAAGAGPGVEGVAAACSTSRFMTRPASPLPLHAGKIDLALFSRLARGRRGAGRLRGHRGSRCGGLGGWRRLGGRLGLAPGGRTGVLDHAEHLADLDVLAILPRNLRQHAGLRGADLEVDLVGLELDERVARGDLIALPAQPLGDARVDNRLADLGYDDVGSHGGQVLEWAAVCARVDDRGRERAWRQTWAAGATCSPGSRRSRPRAQRPACSPRHRPARSAPAG